jgi:hypothetical protein
MPPDADVAIPTAVMVRRGMSVNGMCGGRLPVLRIHRADRADLQLLVLEVLPRCASGTTCQRLDVSREKRVRTPRTGRVGVCLDLVAAGRTNYELQPFPN